MTNPVNDPGQPYLLTIPNGFSPGRIAHITGTFTPNATSLVLKFQSGPYGDPSDEIGLCVYARLNESILGLNAFTRAGGWGQEEAHRCEGFVKGQTFELAILCDPYHFKVAVNGQHWGEFSHRLNPASSSHLNVVSGSTELVLSCVWVEDPSQAHPALPSMPGPGQAPYPPMGSGPPGPYPPQNAAFPSQSHHSGKSGKGLVGMVESAGAAVAGALGASSILGKKKGYPSHGEAFPGSQPQYGSYPESQPQYGSYPGSQPQYRGYPGSQPQYGGYPGGHKSGGGGLLGKAMAVGGGILGSKAVSKGVGGLGGSMGGNKALKYGLPIAGAGLGGYVLTKGMKKGFGFGDSFDFSDSD